MGDPVSGEDRADATRLLEHEDRISDLRLTLSSDVPKKISDLRRMAKDADELRDLLQVSDAALRESPIWPSAELDELQRVIEVVGRLERATQDANHLTRGEPSVKVVDTLEQLLHTHKDYYSYQSELVIEKGLDQRQKIVKPLIDTLLDSAEELLKDELPKALRGASTDFEVGDLLELQQKLKGLADA